jgi:hypothetical protein
VGVAKVDVWIADIADPCKISNATWYVTVTDCRNRVIEWCRKAYEAMPAECGHIEIELPPGCYLVFGALNVWQPPPEPGWPSSNYFTHTGILTLTCEESACLRLYAPLFRNCWDVVLRATEVLQARGELSQDVLNTVAAARDAALENVPLTDSDTEVYELHGRLIERGRPA